MTGRIIRRSPFVSQRHEPSVRRCQSFEKPRGRGTVNTSCLAGPSSFLSRSRQCCGPAAATKCRCTGCPTARLQQALHRLPKAHLRWRRRRAADKAAPGRAQAKAAQQPSAETVTAKGMRPLNRALVTAAHPTRAAIRFARWAKRSTPPATAASRPCALKMPTAATTNGTTPASRPPTPPATRDVAATANARGKAARAAPKTAASASVETESAKAKTAKTAPPTAALAPRVHTLSANQASRFP